MKRPGGGAVETVVTVRTHRRVIRRFLRIEAANTDAGQSTADA